MNLARVANLSVPRVSSVCSLAGVTAQIMPVRVLPPSEFWEDARKQWIMNISDHTFATCSAPWNFDSC